MFLLSLWLIPYYLTAQNLNYDIYLIDIKKPEVGNITFEKAVNISNHAGYDNQPSFTLDGNKILYTAMTKDSTTDIQIYNIVKKSHEKMKSSPKTSEYSPTNFVWQTNSGRNNEYYLTVTVEEDKSTQRIYRHPLKGGKPTLYIAEVDSVGYFGKLMSMQIACFILSSKNEMAHELRITDTKTQKEIFIDDSIGRCIRLSPDSSAIVYVKKKADGKHKLMRYNFHNKSITELAETVEGAEDFLFYDNMRIWMAKDNVLYEYWMAAKFPHWSEKKEFSETNSHLKTITRMNLSPDKTKLVLVAED